MVLEGIPYLGKANIFALNSRNFGFWICYRDFVLDLLPRECTIQFPILLVMNE